MKSAVKYLMLHFTDLIMNSHLKKKKPRKPYVTRVNYITAAIQKKTVHYLIIDCIGVIFDKKKDVTV